MERNILTCLYIFLLVVFADSYGQKFKFGPCRNIPAVTPFDPALFGTTWFEYSRTSMAHEHSSLRCNSLVFTYTAATNSFTIRFSAFKTLTGLPVNVLGTATLPAGATTGVLGVTIPSSILNVKTQNYYVVAIDAANPPLWAVLYSCKDYGIGRKENIIVLTSLRIPAAATVTAAYNALTALGLTTNDLVAVNQVNC